MAPLRSLRLCVMLLPLICVSQAQVAYQRPPANIAALMEEPPTPTLQISPTHDYALMVGRERFRTIADLAQPMLPLAGERINPNNDGPARPLAIVSLKVKNLATNQETDVKLPTDGKPYETLWAPDGKHFAVEFAFPDRIALAVFDPAHPILKGLNIKVNGAYGEAVRWMPDGHTMLVREVANSRGPAPARPDAPGGPEVQESLGVKRPAVTLPDALKDTLGDAQFTYYMACRLALVDIDSGAIRRIDRPGILQGNPSPDGAKILVEATLPPYSRKLYSGGFPRHFYILDLKSGGATEIAQLPSQEGVPLGGVPKGPRDIQWRPDRPATLIWVEALDNGDPSAPADFRDRLVEEAIGDDKPYEVARFEQRFRGIEMTESGGMAIVNGYDREREHNLRWLVDLDHPGSVKILQSDVSSRERYKAPGTPVTRVLPNGRPVLVEQDNRVLLEGPGAGPNGDHPFLDRLDLATNTTQRIWQCDDDHYERLISVLKPDGLSFVTLRESPTEFPNYYLHDKGQVTPLTAYTNRHSELLGITRKMIHYKRADGVDLSFALYLPPNYRSGERLPAVVEAYPLEFTDASLAGEVTGSSKTFPTLRGDLYFLLAGYAVMDNVAMPIVGSPKTVNDTFVEQLVEDAKAAVKAADETGSVDTGRLGVMGHSYGAFMTANLLAHCDLFKAGAAESGAYNRTLTPFGFQSERRTFWQAEDMYMKVSPFSYADKIKHPILLVHGLQDDNPGTYTVQSERLYQAISGNGGTTRLVLLPYEAHGYAAKETIEHVFWEELQWFDKYVKG